MSHNQNHIVENAKHFAISAHTSIDQRRKYTDEPYHVHCERVVKILSEVSNDEAILAAAWMHDVLEDVAPKNPDYSEKKIRALFGKRIADLVVELTDTPHGCGNRSARKAHDRIRLQAVSADAKTIKLADVIDNFIDIQKNNPGFTVTIAGEIELLLPCLSDGNATLFSKLAELLTHYKNAQEKRRR